MTVLDPCYTVSGTVTTGITAQPDGDRTFDFKADSTGEALHIEFIPRDGGHVALPTQNSHITLVGVRAHDDHGNLEVHPVFQEDYQSVSYFTGPQYGANSDQYQGPCWTETGANCSWTTPSDSVPPTAPTGLTATAVSAGQVDLSWTASTDNVGVAGYQIIRNGTQIATSPTTTYSDKTAKPSTTYSYTVVAYDAANNVSPASNTATVTTPADTSPPTAPTNLTATAVSATQVNLAWTASTDNVGVAGYQIIRNGTQIATSTTTSYSDTTVQGSTTYNYSVVAYDAANNLSPASNTATVITPAVTLTFTPTADAYVDSGKPTSNFGSQTKLVVQGSPAKNILLKFAVSGINSRLILSAKLRLYCTKSSNSGGALHRVADSSWSESAVNWNNQPVADTATLGSLGAVTSGNWYEVDVTQLITGDGTYSLKDTSASSTAANYTSKEGTASQVAQLTVSVASQANGDATPPTAPTGLTATAASVSEVDLSWTASTDNVGVTGYQILRNGTPIGTTGATSYADKTAKPSTTYSYSVVAYDAANNLSPASNTATVTTPADTTAPTAPTGLTATVVSAAQIDLSWTASTDNVGVAGYKIMRDGTQIATTTGTTYSDKTVKPSTTYNYSVVAYDAANNLSPASNTATATTPADTSPPTAPTSLTASAVSATQVDLSWNASTDNVAVAGYQVIRDGKQIGTSTGTSYSDNTAKPSTTYNYTVVAYDAANNLSPASNTAAVTTPADATPPTAPTNLTATAASPTEVDLSWTASTDNVGVVGYQIMRDGTQIATSTTTTYADTTVQSGKTYNYSVVAYDAANNVSAASNTAAVTTSASTLTFTPTADTYVEADTPTTNYGSATQFIADATPVKNLLLKFAVSGINGRSVVSAKLRLYCVNGSVGTGGIFHKVGDSSWSESTVNWNTQPTADTTALASLGPVNTNTWYEVDVTPLISGDGVFSLNGTSTSDDGAYYNSKEGTAGFAPQLVVTVTAPATGDTTPPTAPSGLTATAASATQVNLSWTASSDNVGVTGYQIIRDGTQIATSATTSYSDKTAKPSTTYNYTVVAYDAANNLSPASNTAAVTTPADTTAPSVPTNLSATASSPTQVDLAWTASTDNVGVAGYKIMRDGTQIATTTGTSYSDKTVKASTTYNYSVVAYDAANNVSTASNTATVTTPADTTAPTAPTGLTATVVSVAEVDLSWTASTDNVGVAGYKIMRNGTQIATSTTTTYSDTTVQPATTYSYTAVAYDAANNVSAASNAVSVTTPSASLTSTPSADTYVEADTPTTNYGSATELDADASPVKSLLIKFAVSGINGRAIQSVMLRLYCVNGSVGSGGDFHRVADTTWSESTVNWNTQPVADSTVLASLGPVNPNTWYAVNVTSLVTGDGTYSINASSTSSDGAHYNSKEGTAGFAAQLVVNLK
jgi:chitodextrinase